MTNTKGSIVLGAIVVLPVGCADLIDLRPGLPSASSCQSVDDCAPRNDCVSSRCVPRACDPGQRVCDKLTPMFCRSDKTWERQSDCDARCVDELGCVAPPSCSDDRDTSCAGRSCCKSLALPMNLSRDNFKIAYDIGDGSDESSPRTPDVVQRTIRSFALDQFEVSVSRFRAYLADYDEHGRPSEGQGTHPAFPDSGWKSEWDATLPSVQSSVASAILGQRVPWSIDEPGDLPIRGVSWYLAYAFCIWDRGRLPTEAEWSYAAYGGNQQRVYPWATDLAQTITHDNAIFSDAMDMLDQPEPVGSRHDAGVGAFGHDDLAGNVFEWVADAFVGRLPQECPSATGSQLDAQECLQASGNGRIIRGGAYNSDGTELRNATREFFTPTTGNPAIGFRCARDFPMTGD